MLLLGTLTIFVLCALSFAGTNGKKRLNEFLKSSYLIPAMFALYLFSFYLGQMVSTKLPFFNGLNPIILLAIKFSFALTLVVILCFLMDFLKLPIASFGHTISFFAAANIFFFTIVDILFFIPFTMTYIITYISRTAKRIPFLVLWTIFMLIPFVPYAKALIKFSPSSVLMNFVSSNLLGNILFTTGFFPFILMFLRILVRINIFVGMKGFSHRKSLPAIYLPVAAALVTVFCVLVHKSSQAYQKHNIHSEEAIPVLDLDEAKNITATLTRSEFQGIDSNHLIIRSTKNAVRYSVTVDGRGEVPVYDALYDYDFAESEDSSASTVSFKIPDYPPKTMTIDFASNAGVKPKITVTAVYKTEFGHKFVRESIYIDNN